MRKNKGFTLLEILISLGVSCIVFVAFFAAAGQFQAVNWNLTLLEERDSNLSLLPLLCAKWVAGAGNNRWGQPFTGISEEAGALVVRSDMEGPDGFPDGRLTESFESIVLRRNGSDFQIRSNGGTFQPAGKNLTDFGFDTPDSCLVVLHLAGATDRPLMQVGGAPETHLDFSIYLWNYRPNLFAEKP